MQVEVTTYYLEMKNPAALRPSQRPSCKPEILQAAVPTPELNRFLYTAVGGAWYWVDRLGWSYRDWLDWLQRPQVQTWVAYLGGNPAGYFELEAQANGDVEIAYFGLLPQFIGQGLGGYLLTRAIQLAWAWNAARIRVNTCSLDHPKALANYRARGLQIYQVKTGLRELPQIPPGPWPGANTP